MEFGRALSQGWVSHLRRKKMENIMVRTLSVVFAVLVLALFTSLPVFAAEKTHEGMVVTAGDGKLAMTDKDGSNKHTHNVAVDAKITFDGKEVKLEDLKEGNFVKVTTNTDDNGKTWAIKIEAKAKA
jgi:hypothetical protein